MRLELIALALFLVPVSVAYGSEITFSSTAPAWYSYDCSNNTPANFTQASPGVSVFKYFSYYFNTGCYATMQNYDVTGMSGITNASQVNMTIDTRGYDITDPTQSNHYSVSCQLFYFDDPVISNGVISSSYSNFGNFSCTGLNLGNQTHNVISLSPSEITTIQNNLAAGHTTQAFMIFPSFNSTLRSSLDSLGHQYAIEKFDNEFYLNGTGFDCSIIQGSGMCNFLNNPWAADAVAFGEGWIGQWFYVIVFFPFPMACYLITRNGVYSGFLGLGIMLVITKISHIVFEVALSMIAIAAAFAFYEVLRKRLLE